MGWRAQGTTFVVGALAAAIAASRGGQTLGFLLPGNGVSPKVCRWEQAGTAHGLLASRPLGRTLYRRMLEGKKPAVYTSYSIHVRRPQAGPDYLVLSSSRHDYSEFHRGWLCLARHVCRRRVTTQLKSRYVQQRAEVRHTYFAAEEVKWFISVRFNSLGIYSRALVLWRTTAVVPSGRPYSP